MGDLSRPLGGSPVPVKKSENNSASYSTLSLETLTRKANEGDLESQFQLGRRYHLELKDYQNAIFWYRKAAENGHNRALNNIGTMYQYGEGVERSDSKAFALYQQAAENGEPHAQSNLAYFYREGKGVEQSNQNAAFWYKKAADQGVSWAQYQLGVCYEYGKGVQQSDASSVMWYQKAADQNLADAQHSLGLSYYYGKGVQQNYDTTLIWAKKAADQGNSDGQNLLGILYFKGLSVPQNYSVAAEWYRKAAEQGNIHAQYNLGINIYEGIGVPKNKAEGERWLKLAANAGLENAIQKLNEINRISTSNASSLARTPLSEAQAQKLFVGNTIEFNMGSEKAFMYFSPNGLVYGGTNKGPESGAYPYQIIANQLCIGPQSSKDRFCVLPELIGKTLAFKIGFNEQWRDAPADLIQYAGNGDPYSLQPRTIVTKPKTYQPDTTFDDETANEAAEIVVGGAIIGALGWLLKEAISGATESSDADEGSTAPEYIEPPNYRYCDGKWVGMDRTEVCP